MWGVKVVCVVASLLWNSLLMKAHEELKHENRSPLISTYSLHSLAFSGVDLVYFSSFSLKGS